MQELSTVSNRDLGQLVETARAMVSEQFLIAERLDRKARYQVATAGAFFALVQALAVNAIISGDLSEGWIATLGTIAIVPALLTIGALITTARAWQTQAEKDLPLEELHSIAERLQIRDELALRELAHHYLHLVEERREQNERREIRVRQATAATQAAVIVTGIQLIVVFAALAW